MTHPKFARVFSMTGYGEAKATIAGVGIVCRARSVNHRFLDLKLRLPRGEFVGLDSAIRKRVSELFTRGTIEVSVAADTQSKPQPGTTYLSVLNFELADTYWKAAHELSSRLSKNNQGISAIVSPVALTIDTLLRLPGVIAVDQSEQIIKPEHEAELLSELIEPALSELKTARSKEGEALTKHLSTLLTEMNSHLGAITELEPIEKERARQTVAQRIEQTLAILGSDPKSETFQTRLKEEASFWIEKRDFEEERVRFSNHLHSFIQMLGDEKQTLSGKKLEFMHQELLRETNTLGTKAQSPAISIHTIAIKTALEKLKEQLANVE